MRRAWGAGRSGSTLPAGRQGSGRRQKKAKKQLLKFCFSWVNFVMIKKSGHGHKNTKGGYYRAIQTAK